MHPQHWLTDQYLTEAGKVDRKRYTTFVSYLEDLGLQPYQKAHALHLLQNVNYSLLPDGYATPPHTINFCVNNICNFRCSYCDLNHARQNKHMHNEKTRHNVIDPTKKHELSIDVIKRVIDEVAWFKPTIRVPWMEPLLYKNFFKIVEHAKSYGLNFSMLSNGLLLKKFAEKIADHDVDAIRISLDGPELVHEKLCGVPGSYAIIMEGLHRLVQLRKQGRCKTLLGCYFTLNDSNCHDMIPMLEELDKRGLLEEMSVSFYLFNFISKKMAEKHNNEHAHICNAVIEKASIDYIHLNKIDIDEVLKQKDLIKEKYGDRNIKIHYRPSFTKENMKLCLTDDYDLPQGVRCDTHWHACFVNPNGALKVLPQCMLDSFGNIINTPFMDVWNGDVMRKQRLLLQEHGSFYGCARCWSTYYSMEDLQNTWKDDANVSSK